ncbi:threonine ammonia-lyase [Chelatococcus asaccharovorans]|uniref:Threonine dehydratase n=1 Tax=Chelatococcus asaccharovorans TaxID=28210 RepID=A0A2V3UI76_9HYPH|nr:threonine/serine dehydratase [Chelatococcus asaccharovorans]MBS7701832.1 threonine/serine dehydratase [Chelatococcus asaccharovorans]PXW64460.1 threonine dehydratase [Chelatococcus asaccharovorans]
MTADPIGIAAVRAAAARIGADIVRTPVLTSPRLDALARGRVFIKAENLQRTGSFKFRGAANRIRALDAGQRSRGVVAFSSGNHALAIAEASRLAGVPATVIMPADAPGIKIDGARQRGARVILYDREREDREQIGRALVTEEGLTLVSPFDDPFVIAGQGTGALEAVAQVAEAAGAAVDQALVCCSGGGLAAGWAIALAEAAPAARVVTVEPAGFDDMARSLASGAWERNPRLAGSICDALLVPTPGRLTLPILAAHGARGVAVSDDAVLEAVRFAAQELKLVLEPGGAAALAAVLTGSVETAGRNTLLIASGGNVDPAIFQAAFRQSAAA